MLGKVEGKIRPGRERMRWLDSITDLMDMNIFQILGDSGGQRSWCATVHGVAESDTLLTTKDSVPGPKAPFSVSLSQLVFPTLLHFIFVLSSMI